MESPVENKVSHGVTFLKADISSRTNTVGPQDVAELSYLVALRLSKDHSLRLLLLPINKANIKSRKKGHGIIYRVLLSCDNIVSQWWNLRKLDLHFCSSLTSWLSRVWSSLRYLPWHFIFRLLVLFFLFAPFLLHLQSKRYFHSVSLYFHVYLFQLLFFCHIFLLFRILITIPFELDLLNNLIENIMFCIKEWIYFILFPSLLFFSCIFFSNFLSSFCLPFSYIPFLELIF